MSSTHRPPLQDHGIAIGAAMDRLDAAAVAARDTPAADGVHVALCAFEIGLVTLPTTWPLVALAKLRAELRSMWVTEVASEEALLTIENALAYLAQHGLPGGPEAVAVLGSEARIAEHMRHTVQDTASAAE